MNFDQLYSYLENVCNDCLMIDLFSFHKVLLAKMELVFKILGPLAPEKVKDAIRQIVHERKYEIVQALKQGGGMLLRILMDIWRKAFFAGLLG